MNSNSDVYMNSLQYYGKVGTRELSSTAVDTMALMHRQAMHYRVNSQLYKKYSSSQNYYYMKDINEIISDSRSATVIFYKQLMDYYTEGEQLKKFVSNGQYQAKMRSLVDYYRYHREIPRVFAKNVYDLYFDHHDRKRKVEYVIITRNLKNAKIMDDPVKAADERLKKQRSKRFDPMLNGLPQYSFEQRYYHHENNPDYANQSKSLYSIFDKLHRVINSSRLSNQSFMMAPTPSDNLSRLEAQIGVLERNPAVKNTKPIAEDTKHFSFLKKKMIPGSVTDEDTYGKPNLLGGRGVGTAMQTRVATPNPDIVTQKVNKHGKDLRLEVDEVRPMASLLAENMSNHADKTKMKDKHSSREPRQAIKRGIDSDEVRGVRGPRSSSNPKNDSERATGSLKHSRKSDDKKRSSREKQEGIGSLFENKAFWRSLERSQAAEDEGSVKPSSLSKGKRKNSNSLKRSINFNFNWTKVNKILANPLLINKTVTQSKAMTQREGKIDGVVAGLTSGKNYLDQKSKIVKGYHHKVNSMLLTHINQESKPETKLGHKPKISEVDLFSRKNSYGDLDMKVLVSHRMSRERQAASKQKFISHSKKSSLYNASNIGAGIKKKSVALKRKKKKTVSGTTLDLRTMKTSTNPGDEGSIVEGANKKANRTTAQLQSTSSFLGNIGGSQHKHSKSEPEAMFNLHVHRRGESFLPGSMEFEQRPDRANQIMKQLTSRLASDLDGHLIHKRPHNLMNWESTKR